MLKRVYHIVIWLVKHFFDFFTPSLFQRGKLTSSPFGRWPERASGPEGKGRQGGIFKVPKYYKFLKLRRR
jgi:hypothetical protein